MDSPRKTQTWKIVVMVIALVTLWYAAFAVMWSTLYKLADGMGRLDVPNSALAQDIFITSIPMIAMITTSFGLVLPAYWGFRAIKYKRVWRASAAVLSGVMFAMALFDTVLLLLGGAMSYQGAWPWVILLGVATLSAVLYVYLFSVSLPRKLLRYIIFISLPCIVLAIGLYLRISQHL